MLRTLGAGDHRRGFGDRPGVVSLWVVAVFALVAVLLMTKLVVDSRGISSDLDRAITPAFNAVEADLDALPVLDRTGRVVERIATDLLPILTALGRAADSTTLATRETVGIRDHLARTAISVANTDSSVAAIRAGLAELAPLVLAIEAGTGDVAGSLTQAAQPTRRAALILARILEQLTGVTVDAGAVRANAARIEAVLRRIERTSASIAGARLLKCPDEPGACVR